MLIHATIQSCFSFRKYIHTFSFHRGHAYLKKEEREREKRKRKESLSTNAHKFNSLQKREERWPCSLQGKEKEE
jgi:hypothetical protein